MIKWIKDRYQNFLYDYWFTRSVWRDEYQGQLFHCWPWEDYQTKGLRIAVQRAKKDRKWAAAWVSPTTSSWPDEW